VAHSSHMHYNYKTNTHKGNTYKYNKEFLTNQKVTAKTHDK